MKHNQPIPERFILLDSIPVGVCVLQEDLKVIFWNKCLENWTNIQRHQILNQKIEQIFPYLSQPKYYTRIRQVFKGAPATIFSSQLHQHFFPSPLPKGELRIQHTIITSIPRPHNEGYDAMIVIQDVSELTKRMQDYKKMRDQALIEINYRQQVEQELSQKTNELETQNFQLNELHNMSQQLQNCDSFEEAYPIIAQSAKSLFSDVIGGFFLIDGEGNFKKVISWGDINTEQNKTIFQEYVICWEKNQEIQDNFIYPQSKCCYFPLKARGKQLGTMYLGTSNPEGIKIAQQIFAVNFAENIALILANIKMRQSLYELSIKDPLTKLYNRGYLEDILEKELSYAQRHQLKIGVIMIDIDYFKKINDHFGHEAGDLVLKTISNLLITKIRKSDFACRYGGEELTVILPNASLEDTQKKAEDLRIAIKNIRLKYQDQELSNLTASFGVSAFPEHGNTSLSLIRSADVALYTAKKTGRDRVIVALNNQP
jgi:diguanylate cyclase (GGDEF)-like protein